ncbi:MAG: TlpA family protein disulfide reductase [Planctomycetes bacterium]|nr:TlpA family protein disulfide reductase [Planctomycetota bacterium]
MYRLSLCIFFVMLVFSAFQILPTFAQDAEVDEDADWREINKLTREYWSNADSDKDETGKKLIYALQKYIEGKKLKTSREKIALSLLVSVFKHNAMHKEIIKLVENFVKDEENLTQIQHLLMLEKQNSLFELDKFKDLLAETDSYLKIINNIENADESDEILYFKAKALMHKAKAQIMLKKDGTEKILDEIDKIIEKYANKSKVLSVNLIKSELKRFESLHPGVKLDDWTSEDINGDSVNLSDYHGKKVVIFFWASWEGKCAYFFEKKIEKFLNELAGKKIEFIAISAESIEIQKKYLENREFSCRFIFDRQSKIYRKYTIETLPYFIYVDEKGNVINSGSLDYFDILNKLISEKISENDNKSDENSK